MTDLGTIPAKIITIPYTYFMDTANLSDLCPVLGQENMTCFDIVYDQHQKLSVLYKPAKIANSTRSIVMFSGGSRDKNIVRYFNRWTWTHFDSHMFYVSDPYCFKPSNCVTSWYMSDFSDPNPIIHSILLKFHQLLNIAFCKFISSSAGAYASLQFSSLYEEIAPWTLTLAINPQLNPPDLSKAKTDEINKYYNRDINWSINYSNIKKKVDAGRHLFIVLQNRLDEKHYNGYFKPYKNKLIEAGIQGWTFQTPAKSFYDYAATDHHGYMLSQNTTYAFIEWVIAKDKNSTDDVNLYQIYREF
jgi:hypothetical protein